MALKGGVKKEEGLRKSDLCNLGLLARLSLSAEGLEYNSHGNFHRFPFSVFSSQPHLLLSPAGLESLVGLKGLSELGFRADGDSCPALPSSYWQLLTAFLGHEVPGWNEPSPEILLLLILWEFVSLSRSL